MKLNSRLLHCGDGHIVGVNRGPAGDQYQFTFYRGLFDSLADLIFDIG